MTSYLKTMLSGIRQWITAQKADWSQNDETAANYIKGRPCYEDDSGKPVPLPDKYLPTIPAEKLPTIPAEKLPTEAVQYNSKYERQKVYTWDGNTDGLISFTSNGSPCYKISDDVLDIDAINSVKVTFSNGATATSIYKIDSFFQASECYVVTKAGTYKTQYNETVNVPEPGIYLVKNKGSNVYVKKAEFTFLYNVECILMHGMDNKRYAIYINESGALTTEAVTD